MSEKVKGLLNDQIFKKFREILIVEFASMSILLRTYLQKILHEANPDDLLTMY
ncbi:hypothetical protein MASR2M39_29900 [Ignavibacteriales bacterium]